MNEANPCRLYIQLKPLPSPAKELTNLFENFGPVDDLFFNEDEGYAYIEFADKNDAKAALKNLNKRKFIFWQMFVEFASKKLNKQKRENDFSGIKCFNCKQKGHIKIECRELRRSESVSRETEFESKEKVRKQKKIKKRHKRNK